MNWKNRKENLKADEAKNKALKEKLDRLNTEYEIKLKEIKNREYQWEKKAKKKKQELDQRQDELHREFMAQKVKCDSILQKENSLSKIEAKLKKDREKFKELTREMLRKEAALKKIEDEYAKNVANLKLMERRLSSANSKLAMNQEKIERSSRN